MITSKILLTSSLCLNRTQLASDGMTLIFELSRNEMSQNNNKAPIVNFSNFALVLFNNAHLCPEMNTMDRKLQSKHRISFSPDESSLVFSLVHISRDFHPHSPDPVRHHGLESLLVSNPEKKRIHRPIPQSLHLTCSRVSMSISSSP